MGFDVTMAYANQNKGEAARPLLTDQRHQLVAPYLGKYQQACREGRLFTISSAAAGIVLPIFSNTAQLFGFWNPPGSGVNMVVCTLRMSYIDTTGAAGGFCWGLLRDVGAVAGTAAPISAFTETLPFRGPLGGQTTGGNRVKCSASAITVTTSLMVVGHVIGMNQLVTTAADATTVPWAWDKDYNGELQLAPGNALFLSATVAQLSKWVPTVTWVEDPV